MATRHVPHSNTSWPRWVSSAAIRRVNRIGCTQFGQSGEVSRMSRPLRLLAAQRKAQLRLPLRRNWTGARRVDERADDKPREAPRLTAQQYLQSQAELCRRTADDTADPLAAEQLRQRAVDLERRAHEARTPARAA
jgi:hypothetical protein